MIFIQFNPEKLQAGGGSGFGLFISKSIVDLHEGRISVYRLVPYPHHRNLASSHACEKTMMDLPLFPTLDLHLT